MPNPILQPANCPNCGASILSGIIALIIGYIFAIANNLVAAHEPMIRAFAIIASLIGGSYILSNPSCHPQVS